jgi:hypothetical protein
VLGCGGMLTGVGPPATPGHRSSPAGVEKREGSTWGPFAGLTGAQVVEW